MSAAPSFPAATQMDFPSLVSESSRNLGTLVVSCNDQPGIVAAVCGFLADRGANIIELQQHSTAPRAGRLFIRLEFQLAEVAERIDELSAAFMPLSSSFDMDARFTSAAHVKRMALMVSTADHALQELLWRRKAGDLRAEIVMVISNHERLRDIVEPWGIPFHHVPVTARTKAEAEERQLDLLRDQVDTVVLARYMQVLSPRFLAEYPRSIINIHHSFLPAFIGADPYSRASERGVKLIGATAHYVTEDLDEGAIIEQDVARIDHRQSVPQLRAAGRYIERAVLARAVAWHAEDRVIVHENKTIVFT